MATTIEFRDNFLQGLNGFEVAVRAMMGEYVVYCGGKVVGGLYDNRLLVKPTEAAKRLLPNAKEIIPYVGSKALLFVENLTDKNFVGQLLVESAKELPYPKKRKK